MPSVTYIPPGLTTSALNMASGGTDNYVMTAVDGDTIQGESALQFDGTNLGIGPAHTIDTILHIESADPVLKLQDTSGSGNSAVAFISFRDSLDAEIGWLGDGTGSNDDIYIQASTGDLRLFANGTVLIEGTTPTLTIGDAGEEDAAIIFDGYAVDYHIGLDDTADDLVIGKGTALGTTTGMAMDDDLHFGVGVAPSEQEMFIVSGTNSEADARRIFRVAGTVTVKDDSNGQIATIGGTLIEADNDGTHAVMSSLTIAGPTITNTGSTTSTVGTAVWILGPPSSGASAMYALFVDDGVSRFDGGTLIGDTTSLNNLIDDASGGSGSTTLYIGNASITVSSDGRLKTDIRPTTINALSLVDEFKVVDFGWDDPTDTVEYGKNYRGRYTGMIAQDTVKIAPWIINDQGGGRDCNQCMSGDECDNHGMWQVEYQHLVPTLVKAIQELSEKIQELEHGNR